MLSCMLILIACASLDVLDTTDQEWVAEGYSVYHEVIHPFEYVQPLAQEVFDPSEFVRPPSVRSAFGYKAFFVDGSSYRIILVGEDKIIVFDEGPTPSDEILLPPLTIWGALFSLNGRYVAVHGEPRNGYTTSALIDLESHEISYFCETDSLIDRGTPRVLVSDMGSVFSYADFMLRRYEFDLNSYSESLIPEDQYGHIYVFDPETGEIICTGSDRSRVFISACDEFGNQLWTNQTDYQSVPSFPLFIPGERLILLSFDDVVTCFSVDDGLEVWSVDFSPLSGNPSRIIFLTLSANGEYWCGEFKDWRWSSEEGKSQYILVGEIDDPQKHVFSIMSPASRYWGAAYPASIGNNGSLLLKFWASDDYSTQTVYRYVLIDPSGEPRWASDSLCLDWENPVPVDFAFNRSTPCTAIMSPDESCIIYYDETETSIHVVHLTQAE